jgi:hypothetical protein
MAIIPVHKAITKEAFQAFKFVPKDIERVADTNAAMNQKQGEHASQTALHAMRGYVLAADPISGGLTFRAASMPFLCEHTQHSQDERGVPLGVSTASKRAESKDIPSICKKATGQPKEATAGAS